MGTRMANPEFGKKRFARQTQRRVNPRSFAVLIKSLRQGAHTVEELAELTGLAESTTLAYCRGLVVAKEAYIAGWKQDTLGRDHTAKYQLGQKPNVPKTHRRMSNADRAEKARYRRATQNAQPINLQDWLKPNEERRNEGLQADCDEPRCEGDGTQ